MSFVMVAHTLIGSAAVISGVMALLLSKGSDLHQMAGRLFVSSMVMMGAVVAVGAWLSPGSQSSLGILFLFFIIYMVVSAWSTIRRSKHSLAWLDCAAPMVAFCISMAGLMIGIDAISTFGEVQDLPPEEAYFFFAALAFIAMLLDVNNLRVGGVRGKHRIVRHVWRMSCALFFAISTLFTGPGSIVFPEALRGNPVLSIPQILVVAFALFWIYRLLYSQRRRFSAEITASLESHDSTNARTESD